MVAKSPLIDLTESLEIKVKSRERSRGRKILNIGPSVEVTPLGYLQLLGSPGTRRRTRRIESLTT